MRLRVLADVPMYGHLPAPHRDLRVEQRTSEPCPECGRGRVIHLSDDPRAVRYQCSRRCGWDA